MFYDQEEFDLSSSTEIDMLLVDLPFDLIKENLRYQIKDPLSTHVNYVETVVDKFDVLQEQFSDNEEALYNINKLKQDFFSFIIQKIDEQFDLGISLDYSEVNEVVEIATVLYNFLILRYKKNINRFIYKFIMKNKKLIVEEFSDSYKKKDVTSISLKKKIKNKDDILILSHLPSVIKYIMNLEIEPLDFLKYACNDEYYEGTYIKNLILSTNLIGNFVTAYLELMVTEYDSVLDEIQTEVKLKLMKKF